MLDLRFFLFLFFTTKSTRSVAFILKKEGTGER